jgi:hypothetical protein
MGIKHVFDFADYNRASQVTYASECEDYAIVCLSDATFVSLEGYQRA